MPEIAMHIMDLVQNCITANATHIRILLGIDTLPDMLSVEIADDGKGMAPDFLENVTSPFTTTRTTRKVGLGIPLMKAGCEGAEGQFEIRSTQGVGTTLKGSYRLSNIDRPPLGDFTGTVHMLITCNPQIDFYIEMRRDEERCVLDTEEIRAQLGDVPLNDPSVSTWIKEYLEEGQQEVGIVA